jgi:hypothetical protein
MDKKGVLNEDTWPEVVCTSKRQDTEALLNQMDRHHGRCGEVKREKKGREKNGKGKDPHRVLFA